MLGEQSKQLCQLSQAIEAIVRNRTEDIAGAIDIDGDRYPLPEAAKRPAHHLHSLLMWELSFLVVWLYCYLTSDNALLMQLRFFKAYLTYIGGVIQNGIGAEFVLSLGVLVPSTMTHEERF